MTAMKVVPADEWFRVEVTDGQGQIVAIEPGMLAGRDIGDIEQATIIHAIEHLSGFIGNAALSAVEPAPDGLVEQDDEHRISYAIAEELLKSQYVNGPDASVVLALAHECYLVIKPLIPALTSRAAVLEEAAKNDELYKFVRSNVWVQEHNRGRTSTYGWDLDVPATKNSHTPEDFDRDLAAAIRAAKGE